MLAVTQGINLLFRSFQHFAGGTHTVVDHFGNIRCSLSKTTEHGLFPNDIGIAGHIGRCGGDLHQLEDIVTGLILIVAQLLHLVQHRNRIDGFGVVEHGVDGLENFPVLLEIEILRFYNTHHIGDAAAVDQDGTQNSLLRLQRLGYLALKQFFIKCHVNSPLFLN